MKLSKLNFKVRFIVELVLVNVNATAGPNSELALCRRNLVSLAKVVIIYVKTEAETKESCELEAVTVRGVLLNETPS